MEASVLSARCHDLAGDDVQELESFLIHRIAEQDARPHSSLELIVLLARQIHDVHMCEASPRPEATHVWFLAVEGFMGAH